MEKNLCILNCSYGKVSHTLKFWKIDRWYKVRNELSQNKYIFSYRSWQFSPLHPVLMSFLRHLYRENKLKPTETHSVHVFTMVNTVTKGIFFPHFWRTIILIFYTNTLLSLLYNRIRIILCVVLNLIKKLTTWVDYISRISISTIFVLSFF